MVDSIEPKNDNLIKLDSRFGMSASISKLATALAKAQGQMQNADKEGTGAFGKYATLASTWDVIRKPLSENELAIYQRIKTINGKPTMCTMIVHSSGEFIDDCELELKFDANGRISAMQAMGTAVTYARRYCLQSVTGVAPQDDDDGANSGKPDEGKSEDKSKQRSQGVAVPKPVPKPQTKVETPPTKRELLINDLRSLVDTLCLPDEEVKKVIKVYAPGKNSQTMTEKQLEEVIKHIDLTSRK